MQIILLPVSTMESRDVADLDDVAVVPKVQVAFKKKNIKKNPAVSRRKLSFGEDDEISQIDTRANQRKFKSVLVKKKVLPVVAPGVDLESLQDLENGPVIENIHNIDVGSISIGSSTSNEGTIVAEKAVVNKKYVPTSTSSTDFIAPSVKEIQNEYGDYDAEDISQEPPKKVFQEDDDVELEFDNVEGILADAVSKTLPNEEFYDLEIGQVSSDEDGEVRANVKRAPILSLSEQIEALKLIDVEVQERRLRHEQEKLQLEAQLQAIQERKHQLISELES